MSKSQETYSKKEKEKKRRQKKKEKAERKEMRKAEKRAGTLDNMMAYIDENGNISDTPPDPDKKVEIELEDIAVSVPKQEELPLDAVREGKVAFYKDDKGYGFIREQVTQETIFVHYKGLVDEITDNDRVTFQLEKGPKGLQAINVTKVKE